MYSRGSVLLRKGLSIPLRKTSTATSHLPIETGTAGGLWLSGITTIGGVAMFLIYSNKNDSKSLCHSVSPESFQVMDSYDIKGCLGEGAYAKVYQAIKKDDNSAVALKAIRQGLSQTEDFQREVNALKILSKPGNSHVCKLYDEHRDDDYFYVSMELIKGDDLFDYLVKSGPFTEAEASKFLKQLAEALNYIHSKGLVHSDLKPENLMISTSKKSKDAVLKVVDFGNSTGMEDRKSELKIFGTAAYLPPEIIQHRSKHPQPTPAVDMFAAGVIMYICLTGTHPFDPSGNLEDKEVEKLILKSKDPVFLETFVFGERTAGLSKSCLEVMKQLLNPDKRNRMTSQELLKSTWIQEHLKTT